MPNGRGMIYSLKHILADQAETASQDTLVNPYQTQTLSSGAIYMPSPGCIP